MRVSGIVFAVFALVSSCHASDDEYTPLVTSDDLSSFRLVGLGPDSISIVDKEIRLTGKSDGYFQTKDSYKNYILKFEWKYDRPADFRPDAKFNGNSGVLLHIAGPEKVWPKSIEVQLAASDTGRILGIQGGKFSSDLDTKQVTREQKRAVKPVGEWNEHEIACKDGAIRSTINGIWVDRGRDANPSEGPIGWQSEGAPIRFRFLKLKKLD